MRSLVHTRCECPQSKDKADIQNNNFYKGNNIAVWLTHVGHCSCSRFMKRVVCITLFNLPHGPRRYALFMAWNHSSRKMGSGPSVSNCTGQGRQAVQGWPGPIKPLEPGTYRSGWDIKQQFAAEKTRTNGLIQKKNRQGSGIRCREKELKVMVLLHSKKESSDWARIS